MSTRRELRPGLARDLGVYPEPIAPDFRPSFLAWAAGEVERLQAQAHEAPDRQRRFEYQNRMAGLVAAASAYGDWLWRTAFL